MSYNLFGQAESIKIVYKIFELTKAESLMNQVIDEMLTIQVRNNPNLAKYHDVMRQFLKQKLDFNILKGQMAEIYTSEFSRSELEELLKFYETDLGVKTIQKMPLILQKSMKLGESAISSHLPELQTMIREKQKKIIAEDFESTIYSNQFSDDSTFSMSIPENWDRTLQLLESSSFQAGDLSNEMYILVLSEELPDSMEYNLTNETDEFVNDFTTTVQDFKIIDSNRVITNNLEQKQISFSCNKDGLGLTYFLVGMRGKINSYFILGWTLTDLYEATRNYFIKAVSTFKEEN